MKTGKWDKADNFQLLINKFMFLHESMMMLKHGSSCCIGWENVIFENNLELIDNYHQQEFRRVSEWVSERVIRHLWSLIFFHFSSSSSTSTTTYYTFLNILCLISILNSYQTHKSLPPHDTSLDVKFMLKQIFGDWQT
jgi:hypothetical protein